MSTVASPVFIVCSSVLQVTSTTIRSRMGSEFSMIRPGTAGLPALSVWEINIDLYWEKNTLVPSVLDVSALLLQVSRASIKAWMSLNFGQIPAQTTGSAALETLKKKV